MERSLGLREELKQKLKLYPESTHRTYPLHPEQYAHALTQQVAREIGATLERLAEEQRYDEMLALSHKIRLTLQTGRLSDEHHPFDTPLQHVQYRLDDVQVPYSPGMLLSHPGFISNHPLGVNEQNLFKSLKFELASADKVDFMVSFIRWSGLQLLWRAIDNLAGRSVPIRILTTNYLHATEPKALRKLFALGAVDLRMYVTEQESFHTKAYLFERTSGLHTVVIGSSNLSYSALQTGHEWNVKLPAVPHIPVYSNARLHFEDLWNHPNAHPVTPDLMDRYEQDYQAAKALSTPAEYRPQALRMSQSSISAENKGKYLVNGDRAIQPNEMQRPALVALEQTRANGRSKGVVVAATGTGKTYLSAFDARAFGATSVLFLAHRDELLENARHTFAEVFGDAALCGKLTGSDREWDKPFLFSTVQMMHRDDILARFPREYFDYIVIDEFHHAHADTYRRVLDYFQPKFLLGLTATPERMDGRDVLELCDHNLVYEIRLRDALAERLLAPFHYFGLSDPTIDYEGIDQRGGQLDEQALVRALRTHQRVDYVIEMMEKFGHDGDRRVALGFCATIDHAEFMAQAFNQRGYAAAVLTGMDTPDFWRQTIRRLEDERDQLEFIFTVDVFNEGIDIPQVNLLLFLRPTDSATIFLQQLGRGLRKVEGKEYVTVLDFIGNYQKSFVVPLALSGQFNHRAFDKDSLRVAVETEFVDLPDGCAVDLEPISREQILRKIDEVRLDRNQVLSDLYRQFKGLLGRPPEIEDFLYAENAPSLSFFISKYQSWVETKRRMGDSNEHDLRLLESPVHLDLVRRVEKMLPVKWPYEFVVLQEALDHGMAVIGSVMERLVNRFGPVVSVEKHQRYVEQAMRKLSITTSPNAMPFGSSDSKAFVMNPDMRRAWADFPEYLNRRLAYGLIEFQRTYAPTSFFGSPESILLYQNYTRNDLIFLFQANVQAGSWREGISKVRNHYLLFINLNKGDAVEEHLKYHDHFVDNRQFHWQSANQTSHASQRGQDYSRHRETDIHIHLFIRKFEKMHGVTLPFTYLGEADYVESHGDNPMNIVWRLHHAVPYDLFMDFIR